MLNVIKAIDVRAIQAANAVSAANAFYEENGF